jgi:transposase
MSKGSGVTRGDRLKNARVKRLRELVPRDGAVIGIDLGDKVQAIAVVDHDLKVLARRSPRVKAFRMGQALDWAVEKARAAGFEKVTVACEPTGPRWMQVQRLCAERGLALVCVQPLVSHVARQQQDLSPHKTDGADCVLIARLAIELHCYIPEELDEMWARLRHLGRRRMQLIEAGISSVLRVKDFLSVCWPVLEEACKDPFGSVTWLAGLEVTAARCGGDPARLAEAGLDGFTALIRAAVGTWGGRRPDSRVLGKVFAALTDDEGVVRAQRPGMFRRIADELGDLARTREQLRRTEDDMIAVLAGLGLTRLGDIPGLSCTGAAAILAETGDLARYDTSRSVVKHAGLSPADNASGAFEGHSHITRRGRPALRLAAWRAAWPVILHNPVMAAKYQALTAAGDEAAAAAAAAAGGSGARQATAAARAARARRAQARVACAAALLRWIYSMTVNGTPWDLTDAGRNLAGAA